MNKIEIVTDAKTIWQLAQSIKTHEVIFTNIYVKTVYEVDVFPNFGIILILKILGDLWIGRNNAMMGKYFLQPN